MSVTDKAGERRWPPPEAGRDRRTGCAACHQFDAPLADGQVSLAGLADRFGLAELDDYLVRPKPPMPPFTGTAQERRLLSIYLLESSL